MSNKDQYFKGQHETETLVCFFRHHWITLIREFLYFIFFLMAIISVLVNSLEIRDVIRDDTQMQLVFAVGFALLTVYVHRFFMKMFNYFMNIGIITDTRIIDHDRTLFIKDILDSIDMAQIQNVEMMGHGFLPNLLGYGDIKIFLNASAVVKTFHCVPNLKFHFRCFNRCMEDRKNRFSPFSKQEMLKHGEDLLQLQVHSEEP